MPRVVALQEELVFDLPGERKVCLRTINAVANVLQINHESQTCNKTKSAIDELLIHSNLRADTIYYDKWYIMWRSGTGRLYRFISASGNMRDIFNSAHSIAFDVNHATSRERFPSLYGLIRDCNAVEEVLFVVRISNGPTDCASYKQWELMELNKDETRVCYERYLGEFIELFDEADIRHQKLHRDEGTSKANIGRLGGPRVRLIGLARNGVRI
ncbi:hypothetical protein BCON_0036g00050 [Botryotinia convoluta]|uniref:Uncharacterized protein n=1 Tax=Botryotinia convoluta TaxID=54673 RepID=A0A4Z1IUK9_9HELO|nr:hypothetical protein BCON_0036g00050 [Botryotinia convoluta]